MAGKIVTLVAAGAFLSFSGPAWADHGDCLTISKSGNTVSVPEASGDLFLHKGGLAVAIEQSNAPFTLGDMPCDDVSPFPNIIDIPNNNGGLPGGGPP